MMTTTTLDPGAKLRAARIAAGLTQSELAERLGKTKAWISNYEVGRDPLSLEKIIEICDALKANPASIDDRLASTGGR